MNKFIMMAPKVIAVTFDQANDMKNKYLSAPKETKSAPVEHEVLNTSSPDLSFGQPAPVTENIFSTPTPEPVKEEKPVKKTKTRKASRTRKKAVEAATQE